MKSVLVSLLILASRVISSPPPSGVNVTDDVELAGDSEEVTVHYDLEDLRTTVSERRALDLTPPANANAYNDDPILKRFGSDYFLNEQHNETVPVSTNAPGVIQKVSRKTAVEDKQFQDRQDFVPDREVNPNISGVNWLLNIFNPHHWNPVSLPGSENISDGCTRDVRTYLRALRNGTIWAAKMTDASGRYSSQFFFGNDFYLGSKTLCRNIQNPVVNTAVPPFLVSFHVAIIRLLLPPELTPRVRQISLGVCLPRSCSGEDIASLLRPQDAFSPSHSLQVLRVRPVPGPYSLLRDPKLHILGTVTAILLVFMFVGTAYENHLERKQRRREKTPSNNNRAEAADKLASPLDKISPHHHMGAKGNSDSDISTSDSFREPVSVVGQVFLSFSALSNARKILHCGAAPKDSLTCVHGLRFLSLAWVIMVHTYLQVFAIAENKTLRTLTEKNFMFQTVSNATFSVDTFFFISGLLVTYLYFKSLRSEPSTRRAIDCGAEFTAGAKKFFTLLGYRFVRLTPAYMFVLGVAELNMRWVKNISVFEPVSLDNVNCERYWWRNALYINSLFPMKDMCMLWSWYLANDTQFYAVGILILLISVRHFRVAVAALLVFLFTSWLTTGLISAEYQYKVRVEQPELQLFDAIYDKPWTRLGPYLVGMFSGWFLFKTKCKVHISKFTTVACWFLSLLVLASLVYGVLNAQLDITGSAIYTALGHTAWGGALSWIVIACCTGHGGYIDTLLSCRLLHPLSRLTYCAYLIHPVLMASVSFQMDGPLHLHNGLVLVLYFGNVVASFLISFCISMTFEAPIVRLLKVVTSPKPTRTNSIEE
ncbi:nose resistant to fluoxetine protein 6-like [Macrosteles quadrilineatus]|uniref:nose resistant to fluoxetine protein 6-like n=1 Tax=Macrosteles quadrilineatus TaxID=74068 RepID=UPI0023E2B6CA|nr:nose resistant to fluoxetine protein 6-like [Macrosteles quadrilineatus]